MVTTSKNDEENTDRMGVATLLPPKYAEAGLLHKNRVGGGIIK
jgi:hypothetical protein